jgi:CubicO group peptidase (beta-lactamase class C family)
VPPTSQPENIDQQRAQYEAARTLDHHLSAAFSAHPLCLRVPAASVAVLADGALTTAAWGAQHDTRFQAASISKPVAALTALRLVARGVLDLDADVNDGLRSWRLPPRRGWAARVTVRQLLCHGGALTMSGYPGYPVEARLPTLVQILDGRPPANTAPVRVDGIPGLTHRYSGGGYVLLQQLLEDITGIPYAELTAELVFTPAGMTTAGFSAPDLAKVAVAHVGGTPVPGGWRVYPEQATAGLWCTPTDLVRFASAIQNAVAGRPGALLPPDLAAEMVGVQLPGWGLGVQLEQNGPHRRFAHDGSNYGYRCSLLATVHDSHAVAVMTNSEDGRSVVYALVETASAATGWPDPPTYRSSQTASAQTAVSAEARHLGHYRTDTGVTVSITTENGNLLLHVPGQPPLVVNAQSSTLAQLPAADAWLTFTLTPSGRATSLTLHQNGAETTAHRQPETTDLQ